jgi:hypothetical protein
MINFIHYDYFRPNDKQGEKNRTFGEIFIEKNEKY